MQAQAPSLSVAIHTDRASIENLRTAWIPMQWHPICDFDNYVLVNNVLSGLHNPYVVTISEGSQIVAIVAARVVDAKIPIALGYKRLFSFSVRSLRLEYGGLMGRIEEDTAKLIVGALSQAYSSHSVDVIQLQYLRPDCPLFRLLQASRSFLFQDRIPVVRPHFRLVLPDSPKELFHNMKSKHRSELRRLPKLLEREYPGAVRIQFFTQPSHITEFCHLAEVVTSKSYLRGLAAGFKNDKEHQSRLLLQAERGIFLGSVLLINDHPCAFWYGSFCGDVMFLANTAFDPAYRRHEVGTILLTRFVEELATNYPSTRSVDFGFGDASYKRSFSTESWDEITAWVFAASARNLLINSIRTPVAKTNLLLDRSLSSLGLLAKIKKFWRGRLIKHQGKSSPTALGTPQANHSSPTQEVGTSVQQSTSPKCPP